MLNNSFSLEPLLSTAQVLTSFKTVNFNGQQILLKQQQGICGGGNYYIDFGAELMPRVLAFLKKSGKNLESVFEAGTGRGIYLNIMASVPSVKKLFGVDINPKAVALTGQNLEMNGAKSFRLFAEPVSETFKGNWKVDLIAHDLPLIPLENDESIPPALKKMLNGGSGGRKFIDFMVKNSPSHLTKGGALFFVQPSFVKGGKEATIQLLRENGFKPLLLEEKKKPLKETILTQRLKPFIEKRLGYIFPEDENGHYFTMQAFLGIKEGSV